MIESAKALLGKVVLVGVTYVDVVGEIDQVVQFAGKVISVDPGVVVDLGAQELFHLPADLDAFVAATPGEYRLPASGQVVVNPDYFSTWIATPEGYKSALGIPADS